MAQQPEVQTAARVARRFNLDPVFVLDEYDEFRWSTRVAALKVTYADDKERAARERRR